MLWPTAVLAIALFCVGGVAERKLSAHPARNLFILFAAMAAVPGVLFAFYYTRLLGGPIWFYEFRAAPATELTAAGAGLLAGFVHETRSKYPLLKRQLGAFTVPAIFAVILMVPYIKPIFRPVDWHQFQNHWQEDVCIQSTPSSCGPASAATVIHAIGKQVSEADLAHESFTYAGGTENWYLVRALRKRGFTATFVRLPPDSDELPCPSVVGVTLVGGTGHFIALIGKEGTNYVVGDPLNGRMVASLSELRSEYNLTGFFLVIQ